MILLFMKRIITKVLCSTAHLEGALLGFLFEKKAQRGMINPHYNKDWLFFHEITYLEGLLEGCNDGWLEG